MNTQIFKIVMNDSPESEKVKSMELQLSCDIQDMSEGFYHAFKSKREVYELIMFALAMRLEEEALFAPIETHLDELCENIVNKALVLKLNGWTPCI